MKIVIVEDNPDLRAELEFLLSHAGHKVESMFSARSLYRRLEFDHGFDILILDLGLPDEDGLNVAKKLKGTPGLGIVILTARGHVQDRIRGLKMGADAYLTKPVDVTELIAVIESVYRRLQVERPLVRSSEQAFSIRLDESCRKLYLAEGGEVALTRSEGTLLKILAHNQCEPVSRRELSEALGQDYMQYDERRLEAIISRLRKKMKGVCPDADIIKAARGIGYQLLEIVEITTSSV